MSRLKIALGQIDWAHRYTVGLLEDVPEELWLVMPGGVSRKNGPTNIAWQVGHLAMAQYRLTLERVRGPVDSDEQLIGADFLALFGKGSTPTSDASELPPVSEIHETYENVHRSMRADLSELTDDILDEPCAPHPMFKDRFGALMFAFKHELLHAGQIALLRRLLGKDPLR